eukprot:3089693-Amphidinium_carterae.4
METNLSSRVLLVFILLVHLLVKGRDAKPKVDLMATTLAVTVNADICKSSLSVVVVAGASGREDEVDVLDSLVNDNNAVASARSKRCHPRWLVSPNYLEAGPPAAASKPVRQWMKWNVESGQSCCMVRCDTGTCRGTKRRS